MKPNNLSQPHSPAIVLPMLVVILAAGCMNSQPRATSLGDMEIGVNVSIAETLPAIPLGRTSFHPSDPTKVNLASGNVQFVEFFAYWCTVCKAMAPTVNGLEDLYREQVTFVYLDRDDPATQALRDKLGYIYQPHFFLLDGSGIILAEWRGYVDGEVLQQAIVEATQ